MAIDIKMPIAHPGTVVRELILPPDMTIGEAAKRLGVSRQSLDALVNCRRAITPEMAKRMELTFGGTARSSKPASVNLQNSWSRLSIRARGDRFSLSLKEDYGSNGLQEEVMSWIINLSKM